MSEMNYVDGAFVYEDVYRQARERRGEKVIISWLPAGSEDSRPPATGAEMRGCLPGWAGRAPSAASR
jgi:hypothetical protein